MNCQVDRVLVIDPIFRGSRLFYSTMAANVGHRVTILTRSDAQTAESLAALDCNAVDIREIVQTSHDSWYYFLGPAQLRQLALGLEAALAEAVPDLIFCPGLDELGPGFVSYLCKNASQLRHTRVVGIYYTPTCEASVRIGKRRLRVPFAPNKPAGRFGQVAREFSALRRSGVDSACIGLLDEQMAEQLKHDTLFALFPDPPPPSPEPSPELIAEARAQGGSPTLLLVGRQSRRKGFPDIQALLDDHVDALPGGSRIVLSGELEAEMESAREFISAHGEQMTHIDCYLSEAEIRARYLAADYVMLPYSRDFCGSSGVLASATSAGKPVITTDHGLVGLRTKAHRLGYCYPSGDVDALARIVQHLPPVGSPEYTALQARCRAFADSNSVAAFQARLVKRS